MSSQYAAAGKRGDNISIGPVVSIFIAFQRLLPQEFSFSHRHITIELGKYRKVFWREENFSYTEFHNKCKISTKESGD
jgi:hypothetical protein